ncbi:hypothetical protein DAI22_09g031000 [Oryza sativa Japonica Group]|nr:hypothetical protein DAI22_09g031000 [Oryza sativa Japonica Group]
MTLSWPQLKKTETHTRSHRLRTKIAWTDENQLQTKIVAWTKITWTDENRLQTKIVTWTDKNRRVMIRKLQFFK